MRPGQVEVRHKLIEQALKLLLVKNQQMVKAFFKKSSEHGHSYYRIRKVIPCTESC